MSLSNKLYSLANEFLILVIIFISRCLFDAWGVVYFGMYARGGHQITL